jgi:hypothetical protein
MKTKHTNPDAGLPSRSELLSTENKSRSKTTPTEPSQAPAWRGVFFDGPEPEQDREGEDVPVWHVYVGSQDAEPVSRVYRVFTFAKAQALAQVMSKDRRLELVADATTA